MIYNNGSGIYTTGAHLQFTAASCFLNPQANTHCIVGVGRHAVREAVAIMRLLIGNNIGRHAVVEAFCNLNDNAPLEATTYDEFTLRVGGSGQEIIMSHGVMATNNID